MLKCLAVFKNPKLPHSQPLQCFSPFFSNTAGCIPVERGGCRFPAQFNFNHGCIVFTASSPIAYSKGSCTLYINVRIHSNTRQNMYRWSFHMALFVASMETLPTIDSSPWPVPSKVKNTPPHLSMFNGFAIEKFENLIRKYFPPPLPC